MEPCNYCLPVLFQYVAYAEGLIRAYNIQTYAVHYTLQRKITIASYKYHFNYFLLIKINFISFSFMFVYISI